VTAGVASGEICPPQIHMHLDDFVITGAPPISTRELEIHGAGVTGTHGMGTRTPSAAAVAEATTGFAIDRHIPKGKMFTSGLLSMMFPTGGPWPRTRLTGRTFRGAGVSPMVQRNMLPVTSGFDTPRT
jgi:hypothetical protein